MRDAAGGARSALRQTAYFFRRQLACRAILSSASQFDGRMESEEIRPKGHVIIDLREIRSFAALFHNSSLKEDGAESA